MRATCDLCGTPLRHGFVNAEGLLVCGRGKTQHTIKTAKGPRLVPMTLSCLKASERLR